MGQKGVQLDGEYLSCSVCLDLLKDPTTLPCGHSYCMSCIKSYWSEGTQRRTHSCPQCRRTFNPRPVLVTNIMLAELVDEMIKTSDGKEHFLSHYEAPASQKLKTGDQEDICPHHKEERKIFCCTDQQCICYICLMFEHRGHVTAQIAEERLEKQKKLQEAQRQVQEKSLSCTKAVKELQQEVENINDSADKTEDDSEEIFSEMIRLIQKRSSEVKQQIRSQQEKEVSRVLDLQEKVEQEIRDLKSKDREMEELSHTEDHSQFLHRYASVSALSQSTHSSSFHLRPLRYFEEVTAAAADTRDKLQELLRDKRANVSPKKSFSFIRVCLIISLILNVSLMAFQPSEPKTRQDFLKYSGELTLDPDTAHPRLALSDANRKATFTLNSRSYHNHPDRFTHWTQVLSRESLSRRRYWEVEWTGGAVYITVAYKNVGTSQPEPSFGNDDKSWALYCDKNSYVFYHKQAKTHLPGPGSSRVGVYLDHAAGVLSFYSVSETMTLLHRVQTTFTQPLHAGLRFYDYFLYQGGDSAEFIRLP